MPLQLGDVSTERRQMVTFNPAIAAEVTDATARRAALEAQGFRLREEGEGLFSLDPPERNPDLCVFRILSENGDDRIVWNRRDPGEVKEAFLKFKEFIANGYTAYATTSDGRKGHKIDAFDPGLEEIVMAEKEVVLVPKTMPG